MYFKRSGHNLEDNVANPISDSKKQRGSNYSQTMQIVHSRKDLSLKDSDALAVHNNF